MSIFSKKQSIQGLIKELEEDKEKLEYLLVHVNLLRNAHKIAFNKTHIKEQRFLIMKQLQGLVHEMSDELKKINKNLPKKIDFDDEKISKFNEKYSKLINDINEENEYHKKILEEINKEEKFEDKEKNLEIDLEKELKVDNKIIEDLQELNKTVDENLKLLKENKIEANIKVNYKSYTKQINKKITYPRQINKKIKIDNNNINLRIIYDKLSSHLRIYHFKEKEYLSTIFNNKNDNEIEKELIQIEKELIQIISNTIENILKKNPKLIRTSTINLIVYIFHSDSDEPGGYYEPDKSNFKDIFIGILITKELTDTYLKMKNVLEPKSELYETILHELTHAFDLTFQRDKNQYEKEHNEILNYLSLNLSDKVKVFLEIIPHFKTEGLAIFNQNSSNLNFMISDSTINLMEIKNYLINDKFFGNDNFLSLYKKYSQELIEFLFGNSKASEIYNSHNTHHLGKVIVELIFLAENKDNIRLILHDDESIDKYYDKIVNFNDNLFNDYAKDYKLKIFTKNNIKNFFDYQKYEKHSSLLIIDKNLDKKVDQFITKISLMNNLQFLKKFEWACNELNIKNFIFDIVNEIKKLDEQKKAA